MKEVRRLLHQRDGVAEIFEAQAAEVAPVEQDAARLRVVQPQNQVDVVIGGVGFHAHSVPPGFRP